MSSKMKYSHGKFKEVSQVWTVLHGAKSMQDRRSQSFYDEGKAMDFFKKKESEGVHVDVFTEVTTIETKKIT